MITDFSTFDFQPLISIYRKLATTWNFDIRLSIFSHTILKPFKITMDITGKSLEYEYENGERYKLLFGIKTVTWECLAGTVAGSSGTYSYGAIEITPNILFISWSKDDGEVVSIVANCQNDILHCCYSHKGTRHFMKGYIKRFTKASIDLA